jgi:hypothetical protein
MGVLNFHPPEVSLNNFTSDAVFALAASTDTSNQGCPSSRAINRCPTAPVQPKTPHFNLGCSIDERLLEYMTFDIEEVATWRKYKPFQPPSWRNWRSDFFFFLFSSFGTRCVPSPDLFITHIYFTTGM